METLFIGKNIIFLPETESTNSYATHLLKNVNPAEGTVVHTANQTRGRGQRGNAWNAEPASNLTASIILKPAFLGLKNQFFLYQITALACYDTMAEILNNSHFDIRIKWPNDVLVNKHKIAGILIENIIGNSTIEWSVIGVGINVNQLNFVRGMNATSLRMLLLNDKPFPVKEILLRLCAHLEKYYLALKNNKTEWIKEQYLQKMFGLNAWLNFEVEGKVKNLLVKGLSDTGLLVLKDGIGRVLEADVKDVKWLY